MLCVYDELVRNVNAIQTNDSRDIAKNRWIRRKNCRNWKKNPPKHDNNLATLKFNNLTEENFAERFRQEKLATNDDFNTAEQQALKTEAKKN